MSDPQATHTGMRSQSGLPFQGSPAHTWLFLEASYQESPVLYQNLVGGQTPVPIEKDAKGNVPAGGEGLKWTAEVGVGGDDP